MTSTMSTILLDSHACMKLSSDASFVQPMLKVRHDADRNSATVALFVQNVAKFGINLPSRTAQSCLAITVRITKPIRRITSSDVAVSQILVVDVSRNAYRAE